MAKATFAATVGAAALAAGVSLAVPQAMAIATADGTDGASASETSASPPTRGGTSGARGSADRGSVSQPRAAAAQRSLGQAHATETIPPAGELRGRSAPAGAPAARPSSPIVADAPQPVVALSAPPVATPTVATQAAAQAVVTPAAVGAVTAGAAVTAEPVAAVVSPAPPGAVAAVTASAGANASSAALIDRLLAPIRTLFGEGTALLIRRTFFNQAPTTAPVQLTGQSDGPITGTIGAIDPEGDPLTYKISGNPLHGTAVVNSDGTYTYTPGAGFAGSDNFVVDVADTGRHFNILDLSRPSSTAASVAVSQGAITALLKFSFIYGSGSQYWSGAARSALETAANRLSAYLVVTSPVTVTFDVTGTKSPFSSTLASAGSDFVSGDAGFLQTVVQNKILSGGDANGSAADGTIDWNFGPAWAFGTTVSGNQYDFESIAMHELLHTFGFLSNIDKAGSNTGKVWTVFDSYVVNQSGAHAINTSNFTWNTVFNSNLTGGNGGLYFGGPNAVAENQGGVALYTPNPWEPGSSLSHTQANYLMRAIVSTGSSIRDVSPVELAILKDIGYTVNGSPTPVLLFVGFIFLRVRRRKD